jgi:quercetin dioxygenase-like cupin family protein
MDEQDVESAEKLLARKDTILDTLLVPPGMLKDGRIASKVAYGQESSVIVATRFPGYHSIPHVHDAEQLNYVLEGELYIFVGEDGFLARTGDFFRVPRNAVHWSRVHGDVPCTLVELHTPPLTGDPGVKDTATALLLDTEDAAVVRHVPTTWPDYPLAADVERRVMGGQRSPDSATGT